MLKLLLFIFGVVSAIRVNRNEVKDWFSLTTRCQCPKVSYPVPVCGVDGKNYFDECYAKCAGTTVSHEGYC